MPSASEVMKKAAAKDAGGAGERIGRAARRHEAGAAADAQSPAFGALNQHDADKRQHDHEMNDNQYGLHRVLSCPLSGRNHRPVWRLFTRALPSFQVPSVAQVRLRAKKIAPITQEAAAGLTDGEEVRRFQACAANQRAIDMGHSQQFSSIGRLDRTAIEQSHVCPLACKPAFSSARG
jgi:hypothetical protein